MLKLLDKDETEIRRYLNRSIKRIVSSFGLCCACLSLFQTVFYCVWHITWCWQVEAGSGDEIDGAASDAGGNKSDDEDDDKEEVDEDVELDEDDLEEVSHLLK